VSCDTIASIRLESASSSSSRYVSHDPGLREALVGERHPPLHRGEHPLVKEVVEARLVGLELPELVRSRAKGVVAAPGHHVLEGMNLVLALELTPDLEEACMPPASPVVDDGDERLTGHVPAEDDDVRLVVLGAVQELAPTRLRPVDVGGEEEPHRRH
jgi:hypothetical protein